MRSPVFAILWAVWKKSLPGIIFTVLLFLAILVLKPVVAHDLALARAMEGGKHFDPYLLLSKRLLVMVTICFVGGAVVVAASLSGNWQNPPGSATPAPRWMLTLPVGTACIALIPLLAAGVWVLVCALASYWIDETRTVANEFRLLYWIFPLLGVLGWRSGFNLLAKRSKWPSAFVECLSFAGLGIWISEFLQSVPRPLRLLSEWENREMLVVEVMLFGLVVAVAALCYVRHGGGGFAGWLSIFGRTGKPEPRADLRSGSGPVPPRFVSPFRAQLWIEWKAQGRWMLFWGIVMVGFLWWISIQMGKRLEGASKAFLRIEGFHAAAWWGLHLWLAPTVVCFLKDPAAERFRLGSFTATRPARSMQLLAAKVACLMGVFFVVIMAGLAVGWTLSGSLVFSHISRQPLVLLPLLWLVPAVGPLAINGRASSAMSLILLNLAWLGLDCFGVLMFASGSGVVGGGVLVVAVILKYSAAVGALRLAWHWGLFRRVYFWIAVVVWMAGASCLVRWFLLTPIAVTGWDKIPLYAQFFAVLWWMPLLRFAAAPVAYQMNRVR